MPIAPDVPGGLMQILQKNGCSPFFFTSALQSTVFGELGRHNQKQLMADNMAFRQEMERLRADFAHEQLDAQMLFRRESYELGRQYLIEQTTTMNENRRTEVEFQFFVEQYWPLAYSAWTALEEQKVLARSKAVMPLRVLIAKTAVSCYEAKRPNDSYDKFCKQVRDHLAAIPGIKVEQRPWQNRCQSAMAEAMNVHYIMRGMPTLLVFPRQTGSGMAVEVAAWSVGSAGMLHGSTVRVPGLDAVRDTKAAIAAVNATAGMVRDAYMAAVYRAPAQYAKLAERDIQQLPALEAVVGAHYQALNSAVDSDEAFRSLSTPAELAEIKKSLPTTAS